MNKTNTLAIVRHHWFVAMVLVTLVSGASLGEEDKVETNDQKLLALCEAPEATAEAIESLLKAGADVDARDERDRTPLMFAAGRNNPTVIEFLLKAGAEVNAKDKFGSTPLFRAAQWNEDLEVTKVLLKAGADVSARGMYGRTPLFSVVNKPEFIEVLLKAGADVNARDGGGRHPIDARCAVVRGP